MSEAIKYKHSNALFVNFVLLLRDYGVLASPKDLLELNAGLEMGGRYPI